jgi:hypothetical protein
MKLPCLAKPDVSDKSKVQTFRTARALLEKENIRLATCTTCILENVLLVLSESALAEWQHSPFG